MRVITLCLLAGLERVLGRLKYLHLLLHLGVVDYTHVAQTSEVSGQCHLETVGHTIG